MDAKKKQEEVKAIQNEIKKNVQGTNSEGKETRAQINNLEKKEEINIQSEQNEETRIQKKWGQTQEPLGKLETFQHPNYRDARRRRGRAIENLFEKIMKENVPSLAKEIDFQEVQEAERLPQKLDPRKHTPRHIIITLPKINDKKIILKAAREKETVT